MATTLDDALFTLNGGFWGAPVAGIPMPGDLTLGDATAKQAPPGTTIQLEVVNPTTKEPLGYAQFTYLQYIKGTADAAAVKGLCGIDTSEQSPTKVCNDGGEILLEGPIAVALATLTNGYFYWFWTGGLCPVNKVSGLDGNFTTDDTVAAGKGICLSDALSGGTGVAVLSGFVDIDTAGATTNYRGIPAGFALAGD